MTDASTGERRPWRILLADDHPPTRAGVRYTLESAGMVICAEAADASDSVRRGEERVSSSTWSASACRWASTAAVS